MMVNLKIIILKDSDITFGLMGDNIKECGKITKWTEEEYSFGQTGEDMKASMHMIKNKDTANLIGQMEDAIKEVGKMESRTEKVFIQILLANKGKEFGAMAKR
jgi:hypothetical protein